jgi:hypothetical protein
MNTNRYEQEPIDFDDINAATWEKYRDRSLDEVLKVLDAAQEKLLLQLSSFEEDQFELHEASPGWMDARCGATLPGPAFFTRWLTCEHSISTCMISSMRNSFAGRKPAWERVCTIPQIGDR